MASSVDIPEVIDQANEEILQFSQSLPSGYKRNTLAIPNMRCGGCVAKIEKNIKELDGVGSVRANLTKKQLCIDWTHQDGIKAALDTLRKLGFDAVLSEPHSPSSDALSKRYLRATAVAGFAAGNIMMLSVAVWAGADKATQTLFHSLSAILAVVAIAYSGSIFFESAWTALKKGRTNMDVPISVGVLLSTLLGLYDTARGNDVVYFEAATMLIFFLLVGRALDHSVRVRAESSLDALSRIAPKSALRLKQGEPSSPVASTERVSIDDLKKGDLLHIATNARSPVDAVIVSGQSEFDTSIVDGEPLPKSRTVDHALDAGVRNLGEPVIVKTLHTPQDSFLCRTQGLVQTVSLTDGHYRTLSERVARWYAPVVHMAALLAGFMWFNNGADIHQAVTVAIAVLIITCPCALGLAVPMVQVLAAGRLFKNGVVMKNGAALERLSLVDCVVFDKTGTLTKKVAEVNVTGDLNATELSILYALATISSHPFSRSIARSKVVLEEVIKSSDLQQLQNQFSSIKEHPGKGVECFYKHVRYRLGKPDWVSDEPIGEGISNAGSVTCFSANGVVLAQFNFIEQLRPDVVRTVNELERDNVSVYIASGDNINAVEGIANILHIDNVLAECSPADKSELVETLSAQGKNVLMVGDGINDTVALAAADVSFAMGDSGDIAANQADFVLMHNRPASINSTRHLASFASRVVKQNIGIAIIYNLIALPIAFAGMVSPLVAAIAMSTSSLLVVGNSLRLLGCPDSKQTAKNNHKLKQTDHGVMPQAGEI